MNRSFHRARSPSSDTTTGQLCRSLRWCLVLCAVAAQLASPPQADDDADDASTASLSVTPDAAASLPTLSALLQNPEPLTGRALVSASRKLRAGLSLGTTSSGRLHRAAQIARDGKHLAILPTHWERDRGFGSAALVKLIEDAAAETAKKHKNTRLMLGDLSAQEGGKISGHRSHQAGRDADIVFFYADSKGRPLPSESMLRVKPDGATAENKNIHFDTLRNWTLVRALLTHPSVEIQYIFVSRPARALLLAEAARLGEPQDLIARAQEILRQPSDSAPHDDHFHIRVFCDRDERAEGCVNRGKLWPWAKLHDDAAHARAYALLSDLPNMTESEQRRALKAIKTLELPSAAPWLADALPAIHPDALPDALAALRALGADALSVTGLSRAFLSTTSHADRLLLALALGDTRSQAALDTLTYAANLGAALDEPLAQAAVEGLRRANLPDAIPACIALLTHPSPSLRASAQAALQHTARRLGPAFDPKTADPAACLSAANDWRAWWTSHGSQDPKTWLVLGLNEHGLSINAALSDPKTLIPTLIAAQNPPVPPLLADNAHALLVDLTDHTQIPASLPPSQRLKQWQSWWKKNQKSFR